MRHREDIAVVGYACRFPQAPDAEAFWALLREGRDAVTEVPPQRWDWRACYDPDPESGWKTNSRWGGFLEGIEDFDAWFFNIAPREARLVDPQQRLFLEVAWEALEHAGHTGDELTEARTGVFVGCSNNGYYTRIAPGLSPTDYGAGIGNQNAVIANRVSFFLNLRGPSVLVDTMCSASLVALHLACQSLRVGECSMALAGGVNVLLSPEYYVAMSRMKAHAPDGRCKAFDHRANGIVLGEGAGVVVLKPLAAALEAQDTIHAVIRGSAVNHGGQAHGLSAPNPQAQAELIRTALRDAEVPPETVSYVEAHGTGTSLGDPVEVEGLIKAFGPANGHAPWCGLGSVKTNIGHLECAAGIAAFIKVLLAMRHRELPALINFEKPNPLLALSRSPFRLITAPEPWRADGPLRAGISSFGMGGTNAHVVVEESPVAGTLADAGAGPHLIPLSAKTPTALATLRQRVAGFVERAPEISLGDLAYTLQNGRSHFPYRWATVCESRDELVSALECTGGAPVEALPPEPPRVGFVFPGDDRGAAAMTRSLCGVEPVFRDTVDRVTRLLGQPAPPLFLLQVALAELWRSWGIVPDSLVGDGAGEYAAAYVSGDLDLARAAAECRRSIPAAACLPHRTDCELVVSLPCSDANGDAQRAMLQDLAKLYCAGAQITWDAVERRGRRIPVPGYPFERSRHWIGLPPVLPGAPPDGREITPHPLLGMQIGPGGAAVLFEQRLAADVPWYLAEHRVGAAALFPATGFFEVAVAAGLRTLPHPHISVEECVIHAALCVDTPRRLQTVVVRTGDSATFQCLSAPDAADESARAWTLHATGHLRSNLDPAVSIGPRVPPPASDVDLDVDAHYADLRRRGFEVGPRFRGLRALRRRSSQVAADVEWGADSSELSGYCAHPALLDACLHALAATFSDDERGAARHALFVPVGCRRVALQRPLPARLRVEAERIGEIGADGFSGDIRIHDESGESVGVLTGLRFQRIAAGSLDATDEGGLFHEIRWVPASQPASRLAGGGRILILGDSTGVADALMTRLDAQGFTCVRVRRGPAFTVADDGTVTVDPACAEDLHRLIAGSVWADAVPLRRVVHLWTLDAPVAGDKVSDQDIDAAQRLACGSILHVVQALTTGALAQPPRLCLITRRGQPTGLESGPVDFFQSLPWGLGRTLALEHPELRPIGIDVDGLGSIEALVDEVLSEDRENQVALRHGGRRIARLTQVDIVPPPAPDDVPLRVEAPSNGVLDDLVWRPASRRSPGAGEVEVQIEAIGLNFRDVMMALGLYPGKADGFGGECAGRITAIGAGVRGFVPGDAVVAAAPGSFATHVTAPAHLVAHRPAGLTPEEAATIPVAFLTTAYALRTVGALKASERVLIHAAAGGVGLAAVQIAQHVGAEIFATAGTVEKRAFLSSLGVPHVMDSRSTAFAADVLRLTGGRGVDVVLNSLAGEFIPRSLDTLAQGGRFLEIGKVDTWRPDRIAAIRPDARYEIIALDALAREQPAELQALFEALMPAFDDGTLRPLPYRSFARENLQQAFRHMAQAHHIGKVVVSLRQQRADVRPDADYLITGGAGALGLHVARSLVERGARHLTLACRVNRDSLNGRARASIETLEALGASVRVIKADVSRRDDTRQLLEAARAGGRPLAGIVHAAGTLDDGVLQQLTYERFERVLAPKVAGAIHLHALTAADPLDFLVLLFVDGRGSRVAGAGQLRGRQHVPRRPRPSPACARASRSQHRLGTLDRRRHGRHEPEQPAVDGQGHHADRSAEGPRRALARPGIAAPAGWRAADRLGPLRHGCRR